MAYKMFSTGLVLAFAGMCLCQQPTTSSPIQYQSAATVSQTSYSTGSAAAQQPQIKLEDIERDNLLAAFGQKTQQPANKPSSVAPSVAPPQSYQAAVPQQQYFVQPYQGQQQQFFMQPYLAQPYQMAFDYPSVQYQFVSPNSFPGNQVFQQFYVPAAQPSAIPQYVTKQSFPATVSAQAQQEFKQQFTAPAQIQKEYKQQQLTAPAQVPQEYKQQQFTAPGQVQQEYKQQQFAAPAQVQKEYKQQQFTAPAQVPQEYKQQQFTAPAQVPQEYKQQQFASPAAQVQQVYKQQFTVPAQAQQQEYKQQQLTALGQAQQEYKQQQQQYVVPSPAYQYVQQPAAAAVGGPADYSYVTRHPAATAAQFKAPTAAAVVQPQYQFNALPQQYQQPQYYYTVAATEQPRVQQSAKSQFSSGVKSTTPLPLAKETFAYKFEQPSAAYSTLRLSA